MQAALPCHVVQCAADEAGDVAVLQPAAAMLPRLLLQQLLHASAVGSDQLPSSLAVVVARFARVCQRLLQVLLQCLQQSLCWQRQLKRSRRILLLSLCSCWQAGQQCGGLHC